MVGLGGHHIEWKTKPKRIAAGVTAAALEPRGPYSRKRLARASASQARASVVDLVCGVRNVRWEGDDALRKNDHISKN